MAMLERHIVSGCRSGNDAARRELYERFGRRLYNICRRYVADGPAAEDLLHDAFVKIFMSFDKFEWRGEGSLRAWIERVTVNMALEHLRRNSRMTFAAAADALAAQEASPFPDAENVRTIPKDVLARFIDELPPGYRTVFNLYCVEGCSHREIAGMLGINEKSSSSQLSRAKALLAGRIEDYFSKRNEV